jgi:hypothetical protein
MAASSDTPPWRSRFCDTVLDSKPRPIEADSFHILAPGAPKLDPPLKHLATI